MLGEKLEDEGYNVLPAINGAIGVELAQQKKPDLILLDLILPELNGFEVLKKIKNNKKTKDIPVIVLTNLENAKDIDKVIELGATTYLVKANYRLDEIALKIKQILCK